MGEGMMYFVGAVFLVLTLFLMAGANSARQQEKADCWSHGGQWVTYGMVKTRHHECFMLGQPLPNKVKRIETRDGVTEP